jgi:hypothetical protein
LVEREVLFHGTGDCGFALTVALLLPTANAGAQVGPSCLAETGPNFEQGFLALDATMFKRLHQAYEDALAAQGSR